MNVPKLDAMLAFLDLIADDYPQAQPVADALRAMDALHQPDREPSAASPTVWCKACGTGWPCPTARALGR